MQLTISDKKGSGINPGMTGLFFEDINYAADGGLYAEMIENRSFESLDCYGDKGDYYVKEDCGYGWSAVGGEGEPGGVMEYVMGSPVNRANPHYLRFTAHEAGQGFANKAYDGIYMEKGKEYKVSFYARCVRYTGRLRVLVQKGKTVVAEEAVSCVAEAPNGWHKWRRYETVLKAAENVKGGSFAILLEQPGVVEFDFISMMPCDAVAGLFRRDLFELLQNLHPGFIRFPGGCIVEGNTLDNRYRWKESVGCPEGRRANFNRWAVHETAQTEGLHTRYAHYNQTLGLGFYEYFLLCELLGAKPLPVLNVGLACQYQSYELVEPEEEGFREFVQDALDLIEFANGPADSVWGGLRARMGHPEPFGLTMIGIGNEQWQTDKVDFFARYRIFEEAIHGKYPGMQLIGSAGPDITSERYRQAWEFYRGTAAEAEEVKAAGDDSPAVNGEGRPAEGRAPFCHAVDEHYYVKPEWLFGHTDFYDDYPRDVKVFAGEYAAHPSSGMNNTKANTLGGALAEAAFLTGVERNADAVVLTSYAPLFARVGYAQWSPDLIWFDGEKAYGTPSYYVQKLYSDNSGTVTVPMEGQEKPLREAGIYANVSLDEKSGELILKAVNRGGEAVALELHRADGSALRGEARVQVLAGGENDCNSLETPELVAVTERGEALAGELVLEPCSFTVARIQAERIS